MFFRKGKLVIHSHFDGSIKGHGSLFSCISDKIILSGMQGKEAAADGCEL